MEPPWTVEDIWNKIVNRTDIYAVQNKDGTYTAIKETLTKKMIEDHLNQLRTIGIFQHDRESNVKWICIDFDDLRQLEVAKKVARKFKTRDYDTILEFSGNKGYHVWTFFGCKIPSYIAQDLASEMIAEFGLRHGRPDKAKDDKEKVSIVEVFPRTRKITPDQFGNMVKIPFGRHQISGKVSYLIEFEESETPVPLDQYFV